MEDVNKVQSTDEIRLGLVKKFGMEPEEWLFKLTEDITAALPAKPPEDPEECRTVKFSVSLTALQWSTILTIVEKDLKHILQKAPMTTVLKILQKCAQRIKEDQERVQ